MPNQESKSYQEFVTIDRRLLDGLLKMYKEYADHEFSCPVYDANDLGDAKCTCGFDELFEQIEEMLNEKRDGRVGEKDDRVCKSE